MSTWHTSSAPHATLTLDPLSADTLSSLGISAASGDRLSDDGSGITTREGNTIHYYHTSHGVRFARVVEPSGFVIWLQEVP